MSFSASSDWMPIRFFRENGQPLVEWCYLDQRRFTEPFFDSTVEQCMRLPFNVLFRRQTPVESLLELQTTQPGVPPTGLIFHMSRCGSTLISQMLAAHPRNIVLSEAPPIDEVLCASSAECAVADSQRIAWLRAMVNALGQRRHPEERFLFIKLDCWHIRDLPLVRAAFPQTPWIFMYRDPLEVMVSQMRSRGRFLLPMPEYTPRFGIDPDAALQLSHVEYTAQALASILQAALDHQSVAGGMFVNYEQLPQSVTTSIASHFGVNWSAAETEPMERASQFSAKNPCLTFADDRQEKQLAVTEAIAASTRRWLTPLYEQLESLRRIGSASATLAGGSG